MQQDYRNAYALSCLRNVRRDPRIDQAIELGLYVVVRHYPAYCPITDASIGYNQRLEIVGMTWHEADNIRQHIEAERGISEEEYLTVEPK